MANVDEAPAACLVACVYVCWGRKVSGVLSVALAGTCSRTTLSRGGWKRRRTSRQACCAFIITTTCVIFLLCVAPFSSCALRFSCFGFFSILIYLQIFFFQCLTRWREWEQQQSCCLVLLLLLLLLLRFACFSICHPDKCFVVFPLICSASELAKPNPNLNCNALRASWPWPQPASAPALLSC